MNSIQHAGFVWSYDPSADVLHVCIDPCIPAYGEELSNFENVIVVMHSAEDKEIVGLRILGFKRNKTQRLRLLIDKEKRAIKAFFIAGQIPAREVDESEEHYTKDLEKVESILANSPPEEELIGAT